MISEPNPNALPPDTIQERWGDAVAVGFVPVPNGLLQLQAKLALSANDVIVILNIVMHWWRKDSLPFPRSTTIARRSGLSLRTVQRSLTSLEKRGLLVRKREGRGKTEYDLTALQEILGQKARAEIEHRPEIARKRRLGEQKAEAGIQAPNL